MNETVQNTIIENAERLLKDADVLATAGSYRTAISLAVLSLEESGKACLIRWKAEGFIKRDIAREIRSGHIDKHQIFGAYRIVKAILSVGRFVKRREGEDPYEDPEFTEVIAKALYEKASIPKETVEIGLLDRFKQDGFYTDLDERLEAIPPSVPYDSDWFDLVAGYAREALEMARTDPVTSQVTAVIYNANRATMMSAKARREAVKRFAEVMRKLFIETKA